MQFRTLKNGAKSSYLYFRTNLNLLQLPATYSLCLKKNCCLKFGNSTVSMVSFYILEPPFLFYSMQWIHPKARCGMVYSGLSNYLFASMPWQKVFYRKAVDVCSISIPLQALRILYWPSCFSIQY